MGSKIKPTNSLLMWPLSVRPSMESTSHSAVTATICWSLHQSRSAFCCLGQETEIKSRTYDSHDDEQANGEPDAHLRGLLFLFLGFRLRNRGTLRIGQVAMSSRWACRGGTCETAARDAIQGDCRLGCRWSSLRPRPPPPSLVLGGLEDIRMIVIVQILVREQLEDQV